MFFSLRVIFKITCCFRCFSWLFWTSPVFFNLFTGYFQFYRLFPKFLHVLLQKICGLFSVLQVIFNTFFWLLSIIQQFNFKFLLVFFKTFTWLISIFTGYFQYNMSFLKMFRLFSMFLQVIFIFCTVYSEYFYSLLSILQVILKKISQVFSKFLQVLLQNICRFFSVLQVIFNVFLWILSIFQQFNFKILLVFFQKF